MNLRKKKVGIVTITNDGYNFGNRLQNYALQVVLHSMGHDVETLNRPIRENQRLWWKKRTMVLHYLIPYHRSVEQLKAGNFFFWNRRYIKWSNKVAADEVLPELAKQYDFFIAGSDQIWNPKFIWGKDPYMFLQFAKPEQRIAYAPSIGVDEVEKDMIPQYNEWWRNWKAMSCRESSGAMIISNITGEDVPELVDPTMLLTKDEWQQLTRHKRTPKKYIVVYMLGNIIGEYKEYIDRVSSEHQCEIVDVMNDMRYAGCSPSKFVALIQHADQVIADSYHAFVFAMLFHRPFTFIDRVGWGMDMNSRVRTVMKKFDISNKQLQAITEFNVDWEIFEKKLAVERKKACEYLTKALQ